MKAVARTVNSSLCVVEMGLRLVQMDSVVRWEELAVLRVLWVITFPAVIVAFLGAKCSGR
jgi:hypothetical protein